MNTSTPPANSKSGVNERKGEGSALADVTPGPAKFKNDPSDPNNPNEVRERHLNKLRP
jgi:hypothetical protein